LRTILDTPSNFHTFRQEFERANRNTHFLIIEIQKMGSVSYTCIHLLFSPQCGFNYLTPCLHSAEVCDSTKNSAQYYQTDFSSNFSGWARDYLAPYT